MLNPPDHQVAGHSAQEGQLGPLVDGSGRFYKPFQTNHRGSRELAFYEAFASNPAIPASVRAYFPRFHGTQTAEASDGSGLHPHIVLEDVVSGLDNPFVIDFKMGARTWCPRDTEDYKEKCFKKDGETTTLDLGFRISGLRLLRGDDGSVVWKPSRKEVKGFGVDDVRLVLRKFVSSNADGDLAGAVYGGPCGILAQLLDLKSWLEIQTEYNFYSVSVLMFRGRRRTSGETVARVKLVDFAHVVDGRGVIDHNFLGGLCSLIKFVSDVLAGSNSPVAVDGHGLLLEP